MSMNDLTTELESIILEYDLSLEKVNKKRKP